MAEPQCTATSYSPVGSFSYSFIPDIYPTSRHYGSAPYNLPSLLPCPRLLKNVRAGPPFSRNWLNWSVVGPSHRLICESSPGDSDVQAGLGTTGLRACGFGWNEWIYSVLWWLPATTSQASCKMVTAPSRDSAPDGKCLGLEINLESCLTDEQSVAWFPLGKWERERDFCCIFLMGLWDIALWGKKLYKRLFFNIPNKVSMPVQALCFNTFTSLQSSQRFYL